MDTEACTDCTETSWGLSLESELYRKKKQKLGKTRREMGTRTLTKTGTEVVKEVDTERTTKASTDSGDPFGPKPGTGAVEGEMTKKQKLRWELELRQEWELEKKKKLKSQMDKQKYMYISS